MVFKEIKATIFLRVTFLSKGFLCVCLCVWKVAVNKGTLNF